MVAQLNAEFVKAIRAPATAKVLNDLTLEALGNTSAEFDTFIVADRANAGKLLKSQGGKPLNAPN